MHHHLASAASRRLPLSMMRLSMFIDAIMQILKNITRLHDDLSPKRHRLLLVSADGTILDSIPASASNTPSVSYSTPKKKLNQLSTSHLNKIKELKIGEVVVYGLQMEKDHPFSTQLRYVYRYIKLGQMIILFKHYQPS
jgi:hypothetical protein